MGKGAKRTPRFMLVAMAILVATAGCERTWQKLTCPEAVEDAVLSQLHPMDLSVILALDADECAQIPGLQARIENIRAWVDREVADRCMRLAYHNWLDFYWNENERERIGACREMVAEDDYVRRNPLPTPPGTRR
jgi:hypothetical protein